MKRRIQKNLVQHCYPIQNVTGYTWKCTGFKDIRVQDEKQHKKVQTLLEFDMPLLVKNEFISFSDSDGEKELNTSRTVAST